MSNPYSDDGRNPDPCLNACQFCLDGGSPSKIYKRLCCAGVTKVLVDLLVGERQLVDPVIDKAFIDAILVYPGCNKLLFRSDAVKPVKIEVSRMILMLLANKLLVPQLRRKKLDTVDEDGAPMFEERVVARLALTEANTFKLHDESLWCGIPLY